MTAVPPRASSATSQKCVLDAIAANVPFTFVWFPFDPEYQFTNGQGYSGVLDGDGRLRIREYYYTARPPISTTTHSCRTLTPIPRSKCTLGMVFSLCLTCEDAKLVDDCNAAADDGYL